MRYYSQSQPNNQVKLIDVKKTRRRIEDALRKTATNEEIIFIANLLGVKVEVVQKEPCSRCGSIDYVATDDYPQGILPVGDEILCSKCRKEQLSE
jgi:hypothetical protein